MRTLILIAASITVAGGAFGQQHLNPVGQGNILHPGIPMSGPPRPRPRNNGPVSYQGRTVYVPYAVPYDPFYSGYGYGGSYYGAPGPYDPSYGGYDPNGGYGPAPAQAPVVVINQGYQPDNVHPLVRDYSNTPLPQAGVVQTPPATGGTAQSDDEPTIFLIAMKDHTIYPVIAYWVDKDTLNYVTVETTVKRVPLDQVDRDLSKQLNDQRNVEFKLPAPAH